MIVYPHYISNIFHTLHQIINIFFGFHITLDHISDYSRPTICRTIPILFRVTAGWCRTIPILFRVTAGWCRIIPTLLRVTTGRSQFRTRRNACLTAGKSTMAAGKTNYGCFEMLSWPHRTLANIINICFCLLETCTKCSYFIGENIRPGAQQLAFEVKYEYIVRQPRIFRGSAFCAWASFQTNDDW